MGRVHAQPAAQRPRPEPYPESGAPVVGVHHVGAAGEPPHAPRGGGVGLVAERQHLRLRPRGGEPFRQPPVRAGDEYVVPARHQATSEQQALLDRTSTLKGRD